jgi:hypothetical protein
MQIDLSDPLGRPVRGGLRVQGLGCVVQRGANGSLAAPRSGWWQTRDRQHGSIPIVAQGRDAAGYSGQLGPQCAAASALPSFSSVSAR